MSFLSAIRGASATWRSRTWSSPARHALARASRSASSSGHGFEGQRTELRVRSSLDPGSEPLASLPITLTDGETEYELVIEADRAKGPLVAEVPPVPREAIVENNRVPFQIASRNAKIRVLYMEGTGSREYHWIRDALIEDPNIECVAMEVDSQYNQRQRLQRVDNPRLGYPSTREELFTYDVIICSDIHRFAFTQDQLNWTVELVAQRGGGFAMIGGFTSFGSGHWDQTVWDGIIPIDMSGAMTQGQQHLSNVTVNTQVPAEVENHPIWRIVDDPVKNRQILDRIPPFYGTNLTDRLKPAATALGVAALALPYRPVMPQRSQLRQNSVGRPPARPPRNGLSLMPVFSCESYGKGRTFALSSDSTVDWGRDFERIWGEGDNRYFRKFWRNVIQWLAENSAKNNRRLSVETDKVLYHPGEPIQVSARAFDDKLEPTQQYRLTATLQELANPKPAPRSGPPARPSRRTTTMTPRAATGDYAANLTVAALDSMPARSGQLARKATLHVTALDGDRVVSQSDLDVQIMDDSPEYRDLRPDPAPPPASRPWFRRTRVAEFLRPGQRAPERSGRSVGGDRLPEPRLGQPRSLGAAGELADGRVDRAEVQGVVLRTALIRIHSFVNTPSTRRSPRVRLGLSVTWLLRAGLRSPPLTDSQRQRHGGVSVIP